MALGGGGGVGMGVGDDFWPWDIISPVCWMGEGNSEWMCDLAGSGGVGGMAAGIRTVAKSTQTMR